MSEMGYEIRLQWDPEQVHAVPFGDGWLFAYKDRAAGPVGDVDMSGWSELGFIDQTGASDE